MRTELGNGGMVLLEGVDQRSFSGDADGNEESIRCESGGMGR